MNVSVFINDIDAKEYGLSLSDGALTALMTPPPLKARVKNASRLQPGSRYITTDETEMVDERSITLPVHIIAKTEADFLEYYDKFCNEVLLKGVLKLEVRVGSFHKTFHTLYESCTQYTQFYGGIAKFQLKLTEPNPKAS